MSRHPGPSGVPAWALALAYAAAVLSPLAAAVLSGVPPAGVWDEAGAAAGSVALAAMVVQFLTTGRFETIGARIGIDVTMAFHKWAARWILAAVLLHPLLYAAPSALADPGRGLARLVAMIEAPRLATGVAAWVLAVLLVVLGLLRKRLPLPYEAWRGLHLALAVLAVAAGLHHALHAGTYAAEAAPAALWQAMAVVVAQVIAVTYGYRWWRLVARAWTVESVVRAGEGLWELTLRPPAGAGSLDHRAGQFVWISVAPGIAPVLDHPFSIASAPGEPFLRLLIKEAGDFTKTVGRIRTGTRVGVDGPHGAFSATGAGALVLVAGGIGIAPILSILRDCAARSDRRPLRLVYGAGSPAKFCALDEIAALAGGLDLTVDLVSETAGPDWSGATGSIDRERLRQALAGLDPATTQAMICGPDPMITAVADALAGLGLPLRAIHYERFDYAGGHPARRDRARALGFAVTGLLVIAGMAAFSIR